MLLDSFNTIFIADTFCVMAEYHSQIWGNLGSEDAF